MTPHRLRIGFDMLATQSPESRDRGVGRYTRCFVESFIRMRRHHDYVIYDYVDDPPIYRQDARRRRLVDGDRPGKRLRHAIGRVADDNPDGLDWLFVLNPFELRPGYAAPARRPGGPRIAAIVFDLIPFVFQEDYLGEETYARRMYRRLQALRHDDLLLAISERTRDDLRARTLPSRGEIVHIGTGLDTGRFWPDRGLPMPGAARRTLERLGIDRPFVFSLGGMDRRKNVELALVAFARLPSACRDRLRLVVTCAMDDRWAAAVLRSAEVLGISGSVRLTGPVDDETLRILYQRCQAFLFPSRYEGFGLPLLEALACGAPVIAGANSSQPEVIGEAGLLVSSQDGDAYAEALGRVLEDPTTGDRLRSAGPRRAALFSWETTAARAWEAVDRAEDFRPGRSFSLTRAKPSRPPIALVTPLPPKATGIGDYAARLMGALRDRYTIEVFHDGGYLPEIGLTSHEFPCYDHRLLARRMRTRDYRAILYQMGNSPYHRFQWDLIGRFPGITTLHDFSLVAFQYWRSHVECGDARLFLEEWGREAPEAALRAASEWDRLAGEEQGVVGAVHRRGYALNRHVLRSSLAVILHSPWCLERVRLTDPESLGRAVLIPHGASPSGPITDARRAEARVRFGIPPDALVLGCFGNVTRDKMIDEAIAAFAEIARERPRVLLIIVGADWEEGAAACAAAALGVADRVRFFGRVDDSAYQALIPACDLGLALRRPPTHGETSGSLLHFLRAGLPTLTTEAGTFADFPDSVVARVRWEAEGLPGLVAAINRLADDEPARRALGRRAVAHIREHHDWGRVAEQYGEVIDRTSRNFASTDSREAVG